MQHLLRCAVALMLLFLGPALAQTTDESAISKSLHTTFDRPDAPLTIAPVVVSGNHAIAGWTQGDCIKAPSACAAGNSSPAKRIASAAVAKRR